MLNAMIRYDEAATFVFQCQQVLGSYLKEHLEIGLTWKPSSDQNDSSLRRSSAHSMSFNSPQKALLFPLIDV